MNLITLKKTGLVIQPRSDKGASDTHVGDAPRSTPSTLRPCYDGTGVSFIFPQITSGSLVELDQWLAYHQRAQMVQIKRLPTNRRTLRALTDVCDRHQVAILVRPQRRDRFHTATETRQ